MEKEIFRNAGHTRDEKNQNYFILAYHFELEVHGDSTAHRDSGREGSDAIFRSHPKDPPCIAAKEGNQMTFEDLVDLAKAREPEAVLALLEKYRPMMISSSFYEAGQ